MKKTFRLVLALVLAAMMIASMIPAMAATTTVTVTINANGGKFADGTSSKDFSVSVDSTATTVNLGLVDNIPNVIASSNTEAFDFWADSTTADSEKLDATISEGKATFYAIWKTVSVANRELDGTISISGLEKNDLVNFYKVLKWDPDAVDTLGWVATDDFAYDPDNNTNGLKKDEIQKILSIDPATGKPAVITSSNKDEYGISAGLAARIAGLAKTATYKNVKANDNGTATQADPDAGLYLALITPTVSGVTYNPVFVSADYNGNGSNFKALDLNGSYNPVSIAKKSKITLEKTASTTEAVNEDGQPETVAAGDTVTFTIETTIPKFAANYTSAKFFVTDTLSKGLELDKDSIKVYEGWESDNTISTELSKTYDTDKTAYTVTPTKVNGTNNGQESFKVDFTTDYLLNGMGNLQKNITIKYNATVTTDAPRSVNLEKNEVTVNYSNKPSDGEGKGKLKDETKHYTFDIDGYILGPKGNGGHGEHPWQTTEVVKVGLDANGNEITQTVTLHGTTVDYDIPYTQEIGALEGAKFLLYNAVKKDGNFVYDKDGSTLYTNDIMKTGYEIRSDATGRLTIYNKNSDNELVAETIPGIRGLDIGTYYLVETEAPAGYIKQQEPVKVEIIAPKAYDSNDNQIDNEYWKKVTYTETADGLTVTWDVWELKKYDVKIAGDLTASYTFFNEEDETKDRETLGIDTDQPTLGDNVTGANGAIDAETENNEQAEGAGKIVNTQGVELPHTGGIGTTLFYIGGSILVLAAVILLVTKRRMGSEE